MQYFVSIENTSYFYWQVELLIESFKMQGLEKDLIIAVAEDDSPKIPRFSHNIVRHPNLMFHHNEGVEKGYKPYNRLYSIIAALRQGVLKPPFTLIHSDMVMVKPVTTGDTNVVFHMVPDGSVDAATRPYVVKLAEDNELDANELPPRLTFNGPIIFDEKVTEEVFWRARIRMEEILRDCDDGFPAEKVAWSIAFYEMLPTLSFSGQYLCCQLVEPLEKLDVPFVHYQYGVPPVFHKKHFSWNKPNLSMGVNPYELLLEHNPTVASNHLQRVIRSYMKKVE